MLNDAQIVCTTLSCAGYAMFNSLKSGFDTVLVDEAAQAVEVSSLIARFLLSQFFFFFAGGRGVLPHPAQVHPPSAWSTGRWLPGHVHDMSTTCARRYACRRLILVGDPKQLPATVFSEVL